MKMHLAWTIRAGAVTWEYDNPKNDNRQLFAAWVPPNSITIDLMLFRSDGEGGYAIIDAENGEDLLKFAASFAPWYEFELVPVVDMGAGLGSIEEGVRWRSSVLGGTGS